MAKRTQKDPLFPWDHLLGTWVTTGTTLASPGKKAIAITGTDRYERVLDSAFVLHTAHVRMGRKNVEVMELIGYDAATDTFPLHAFDNDGHTTAMTARVVKKGVFQLLGKGMRAELVVHPSGGTMKALWERSLDGWTWEPWMTMEFVRQEQGSS